MGFTAHLNYILVHKRNRTNENLTRCLARTFYIVSGIIKVQKIFKYNSIFNEYLYRLCVLLLNLTRSL